MTDIPYKQCSKCHQWHPATTEFFYRDSTKQDGLHTTCKVCAKARSKAYQEAHKEQIRENKRLYQQAHKEHLAAYIKQWQQENSREAYLKQWQQEHQEEQRIYKRMYYLSHQEELREHAKQYGKTEQGRLVNKAHKHRRKAQKLAAGGSYTARDIHLQLERQKHKCYWCHKKLEQYHIDHVIPLARGGSNAPDNLVLACPRCNMSRKDRLPHEWPEGNRLL